MPAFQVITASSPTSLSSLVAGLPPLGASQWLVLPSERQASAARTAARIDVDPKETETSPILTIRAVPIRLLKCWREYRTPVSPTFRRLVVRQCVSRLVRPEDYFGRVRETAGFPPALADLLRELKQACVDPELLLRVGNELASHYVSQKTGEIANLYAEVESQLNAAEEVDDDDLIRKATGRLEEGERDGLPESLDVAGFYQFTTAQLLLLRSLAGAGVTVRVHLLEDDARPLLFAATSRTRLRLQELGAEVTDPSTHQPSPPNPLSQELERGSLNSQGSQYLHRSTHPPFYPPALDHLERFVFRPDPVAGENETAITVLEAPGDYVEGEMIALRMRQLHDDNNIPYGEMAVVVRSVGQHAARLRSIMHRFEVPFTASTLEPLAENPAVQFLIRLFELLCSEWPRSELLRVLRSSYLGLDLEAADRLERAARREGVLEGPEAFLELGSKVGSRPLVSFLRRLQGWQEELASPVPPRDQAARLRRWALSCLWGRARRPAVDFDSFPSPTEEVEPGTELLEGDRPALRMAYQIANEMVRAAVHAGGPVARLAFDETAAPSGVFIEELLALWRSATYSLPRGKDDRVLLLDAYDVTPQEFRVVFVAGLLEGLFPRRPAEDPFFRDGERAELAGAGIRLSTSLEGADEEKLLFYRAVSAARDQLFLTYPRVSREGREVLRSFYVDEVAAVIGGLGERTHSRTLADVAPEPHEALSIRDRACSVAVAAGDWRRPADKEFIRRCRFYQNLHRSEAHLLFRLRDNAVRPPPFRLESGWGPGGDNRSFGVHDIETFLTCPYRYFAGRRLKLNVEKEGPDQLDQGTILHGIVRQFLEEVGDGPLPERDLALHRLETLLDEKIQSLKRDALPYQRRMLRLSLVNLLPPFLDREMEYRQYSRLTPGCRELVFGDSSAAVEGGETLDPRSSPDPLVLEAPDGPPVQIHGRIDRVDFSPGGLAAIVDYKLGAIRTLKDMQSGKSLQMPLYMMALERVFGMNVGAAFYDSFDKNERQAVILLHEHRLDVLQQCNKANGGILVGTKIQELTETASAAVLQVATEVTECRIETTPGDHCSRCDFGDVCRV